MAHKKGEGSVKNGRDSQSKRLGVKIFGGQPAIAGNIIIDERTVLELEIVHNDHSDFHYALNEITVTKMDSSSMISIAQNSSPRISPRPI